MSDCTHRWEQIDVDLFRPAIKVRCAHCRAVGEILDPTSDETTDAFYASEETPLPVENWQRVSSSANVETLAWARD